MCRCRLALSPLLLLLPALNLALATAPDLALATAPDHAPATTAPQRPPSPLDSPELAWLVVHDAPPAGPVLLRRITPKSVFVAPTFTGCSEGYRQDNMGRCVKVVKVNQAAQWDFFLQKLNAMYAPGPQASSSSLKPKDPTGPFHVSLSLAGVATGVEETTEPPDSTTVLTTRIASTTRQPSTTVIPMEQTESEPPSSLWSTLETTPRTELPIDTTTLTTTDYTRDKDTGKTTSADSSITVLNHMDVENVTKSPVTIEPSDNSNAPFVIVVANSSLDSSTTGAIVMYNRQVVNSETSEIAFTQESNGTVATGEMSTTEVYILEPSETTMRRTVDLVRPNLNIRAQDNVRSRCNLSMQVTQIQDSVSDALRVDCEPELTTSRSTVVRFPSLVGDTGKGPGYVRFPESQTSARLRRPVDHGWDADHRPYWWPTSWDSPQQHPIVTSWSQPQQGSASFNKQYHQYSQQPLWQQPSWPHRTVFQRG